MRAVRRVRFRLSARTHLVVLAAACTALGLLFAAVVVTVGSASGAEEFDASGRCASTDLVESGSQSDVVPPPQPLGEYDYERDGLFNLEQKDFGENACFPVAAAMSFTYLEKLGAGKFDLVPDNAAGPDYFGLGEQLMSLSKWTAAEGTSGPDGVRGIAKYIEKRNAAGKLTITYYSEALKNENFKAWNELEKEKALDGTPFEMRRGEITEKDLLKEMAAGEDVLLELSFRRPDGKLEAHAVDIHGMDKTPNAAGNYDILIANPARPTSVPAEVRPQNADEKLQARLKMAGRTWQIKGVVAVSIAKEKKEKLEK